MGIGLIACNRHSHPNAPEAVEQAIGMAPTSVAATRTLITDTEVLQSEGFVVYGYKESQQGKAQQVFAHQAVNYNHRWSYTPTRYWDRAASYYFGAFSPQSVDASHQVTDDVAHAILIEAPHWQPIDGNEADIIVATSHDSAENYMEQQGGMVNLAFEHILSQLEVQFIQGPFLMNKYRIHTVSYKNVPVAESIATYTLDYTTPQNSAMQPVAMTEGDNSVAITSSEEGYLVQSDEQEPLAFKHLVVPFSTTSPTGIEILVDYSVGNVRREAAVVTQLQTLDAGKHYILTLTFSSGIEIVPTIYINDWVEEDLEEEKYNW